MSEDSYSDPLGVGMAYYESSPRRPHKLATVRHFSDINQPFGSIFSQPCKSKVEVKLPSAPVKPTITGTKKDDGSLVLGVRFAKEFSQRGVPGKVELNVSGDASGRFSASVSSIDKFAQDLHLTGSFEGTSTNPTGRTGNMTSSSSFSHSLPCLLKLSSKYYLKDYGLGLGLKYSVKYRDGLTGALEFNSAYVPSASKAFRVLRGGNDDKGIDVSSDGTWAFGFNVSMALGSTVSVRSRELRDFHTVASYRAPDSQTNFSISSETGDDVRFGAKYIQPVAALNGGRLAVSLDHIKKLGSNTTVVTSAVSYHLDQLSSYPSSSSSSSATPTSSSSLPPSTSSWSRSQVRGVLQSTGLMWLGYSASLGNHTDIKAGVKFNLMKNFQSSKHNQFGFSITFRG